MPLSGVQGWCRGRQSLAGFPHCERQRRALDYRPGYDDRLVFALDRCSCALLVRSGGRCPWPSDSTARNTARPTQQCRYFFGLLLRVPLLLLSKEHIALRVACAARHTPATFRPARWWSASPQKQNKTFINMLVRWDDLLSQRRRRERIIRCKGDSGLIKYIHTYI